MRSILAARTGPSFALRCCPIRALLFWRLGGHQKARTAPDDFSTVHKVGDP